MNDKKCPVCGYALEEDAKRCAACGMTDLNCMIMSRQEHMKWISKVLQPHMAQLHLPRVYAGYEHMLILTGEGKLYGLGKNWGQIVENGSAFYDQPKLMATNVIHAAAGRNYAIYVTCDGEVELQGVGEYVERFTGYSGATQVYAQIDSERFWIVDEQGEVSFFGDNPYGMEVMEEKKVILTLPEEIYERRIGLDKNTVVSYGSGGCPNYRFWETSTLAELRDRIQAGTVYRKTARKYGSVNVELTFTETASRSLGGRFESSEGEGTLHTVLPEIVWMNRHIYTPQRYRKQSFASTPYRYGSMPYHPYPRQDKPSQYANVKKAVYFQESKTAYGNYGHRCRNDRWLLLLEDGTVQMLDEKGEIIPLHWQAQPVHDLAVGCKYALLSCRSGELLWVNVEDLEKGELHTARRITMPGGEA